MMLKFLKNNKTRDFCFEDEKFLKKCEEVIEGYNRGSDQIF